MIRIYCCGSDNDLYVNIHDIIPDEYHPPAGTPITKCLVPLYPSKSNEEEPNFKEVGLTGLAWGDNIVVMPNHVYAWHPGTEVEVTKEPFFSVIVNGNAYHGIETIDRPIRDNYNQFRWSGRTEQVQVVPSYGQKYDHHSGANYEGIPYNYLNVTIKAGPVAQDAVFRFQRPIAGTALIKDDQYAYCSLNFYGLDLTWKVKIVSDNNQHPMGTWPEVWQLFNKYDIVSDNPNVDGPTSLWTLFLKSFDLLNADTRAIKGMSSKKGIAENLYKLEQNEPTLFMFWRWMHSGKTTNGFSNNSLLSAFLEVHGRNYAKLVASLRDAMNSVSTQKATSYYLYNDNSHLITRVFALQLPGANEKRDEKLATKDWSLRKGLINQAEGLGITKQGHPKLFMAIKDGEIPLTLFRDASNKNQPVNTEFDLWEKGLGQPGWAPVLFSIAQSAAKRSTYEKDVTPYLSFLFRITKYLDRHAKGKTKWKAMPKFVSSEWELEMSDEAGQATTKKRSALTPVADNETRVITVPYASLSIRGVRTTYCYSLRYYVHEEHTLDAETGTPVFHELAKKLNGRDDYGFMYYTLTGTGRNRGYPAFLIIFERLERGTRVHFHRVHPSRHVGGVNTLAYNQIEECYRYMAGNIRAEEIHAQQGDLIFIKSEQNMDFSQAPVVLEFESHKFKPSNGKPIRLLENTAKSIKNRLGFISSEESFIVDHPEHDPIANMPAGVYEVRRCRSWEANPVAIWSLTID